MTRVGPALIYSRLVVPLLLLLCAWPSAARIMPEQIAIIVNADDVNSRQIAEYYRQQRAIPASNILEVKLPLSNAVGEEQFRKVHRQLVDTLPDDVQYLALAWSRPFKAGCMSITAAFTFGYDASYCAKGCKPTRTSSYYDADIEQPYTQLGIRPAMLLAGSSKQAVFDTIDRGVAADGTAPQATAYLMDTTDRNRNVRARSYLAVSKRLSDRIDIEIIKADVLADREDVMFYITGLKRVESLDSNSYLPGAIADHLTSAGGRLFGGRQMSILEWLDAGVTASYGTVVEPCAFPQKFPDPGIVIERYTAGEALIEAYWKSVAWPGQGVFVGEPMASPYGAPGSGTATRAEPAK